LIAGLLHLWKKERRIKEGRNFEYNVAHARALYRNLLALEKVIFTTEIDNNLSKTRAT